MRYVTIHLATYIAFGVVASVLEFTGIVECFRKLVEHFKSFRFIAAGLFAVIATIAVLLGILTNGIGKGSNSDDFIGFSQFVNVGFVVTIAMLLGVATQTRFVPINRGTILASWAWILRFAMNLTAFALVHLYGGAASMPASWIIATQMIVCGVMWIVATSARMDVAIAEKLPEGAARQFRHELALLDRFTRSITRHCKL